MKIENLEYKKQFLKELDERRRRHFLALEAMNLGHGGIITVSEALGVDRKTVRMGIQEIISQESLPPDRIRKEGGGRKKSLDDS